jgi:hypothetical protein
MITLAMPIYNNSHIAWLQLEALCNQKKAGEFELIIAEEDSENFCGAQYFKPYLDRLKKVGCVRVEYLHLSEWVALGQKWTILMNEMSAESIGFLLVSSDDFSSPDRLAKTREALEQGAEWVHSTECHFFNIETKQGAKFKCSQMGVFQALSREAVSRIQPFKSRYPKKAVDTWLFKNSNPLKITDIETKGICTDGRNSISKERHRLYENESFGDFTKIDGQIVLNLFPKKIQNKLK